MADQDIRLNRPAFQEVIVHFFTGRGQGSSHAYRFTLFTDFGRLQELLCRHSLKRNKKIYIV
jgi:hypothetical protein